MESMLINQVFMRNHLRKTHGSFRQSGWPNEAGAQSDKDQLKSGQL